MAADPIPPATWGRYNAELGDAYNAASAAIAADEAAGRLTPLLADIERAATAQHVAEHFQFTRDGQPVPREELFGGG